MYTRNVRRSLLLGCTVGLLLLPGGTVFGQAREEKARAMVDGPEVVRLIEEGRIGLRDAIAVAEKHTSGHALTARAMMVVQGSPEGKADSYQSNQTPRRLVYLVECFDKGKLLAVRVDAETRQVSEVKPLTPTERPAKP